MRLKNISGDLLLAELAFDHRTRRHGGDVAVCYGAHVPESFLVPGQNWKRVRPRDAFIRRGAA